MRILSLLFFLELYLFANAHIFVYHRFDDPRYKSADTTTEQLTSQFEYFKTNGYEVVPLSKISEKLKAKEKIPNNWIALTIDDAYKSFYKNGLKTFKKYNYPFTLFVYTKATTNKYGDFMTWDMIKEASQYGEIGLHSHRHPHLTHLSKEEVYKDTQISYELFTKHMGYKPKYYAYPYGEYNKEVENTIKKFDFDMILNQNSGSVKQNSDRFNIERIALVGKSNIKQKIRYNSLDVIWLAPNKFPEDGILKYVKAKVHPSIKNIKLYISGHGWADLKVKDGIISHKLNAKLKRKRTRVSLSTDYYTIDTKILIKEKRNNVK